MHLKLELIAVPVTDVDRARAFYEKVGFNLDHDHTVSEDLRFVQLTPPGSACSICIGKGLTDLKPGSIDMIVLVVADADAARDALISQRGRRAALGALRLCHRPGRQQVVASGAAEAKLGLSPGFSAI